MVAIFICFALMFWQSNSEKHMKRRTNINKMMAVCFPSILFLIAFGPIPSIIYFDRKFTHIKFEFFS